MSGAGAVGADLRRGAPPPRHRPAPRGVKACSLRLDRDASLAGGFGGFGGGGAKRLRRSARKRGQGAGRPPSHLAAAQRFAAALHCDIEQAWRQSRQGLQACDSLFSRCRGCQVDGLSNLIGMGLGTG